jgi:hypothetical protein
MADKPIDDKTYLTPKEAARYLRRSPGTLAEWRLLKSGPRYYKIGPSKKAPVLYHRHDLDLWMARHIVGTEEQK